MREVEVKILNKRNSFSSKVKIKSLTVLLGAIFLLSTLASAQLIGSVSADFPYDWPMFRHDVTHSGYSESPAPSTNQTLWNSTIGVGTQSVPAIADGKVYVGSWAFRVYCFDAASGARLWFYVASNEVWSSPAVANGVVYIGSSDGQLYAFSFGPPIPEGLTLGVMLSPSSIVAVVSIRYFRKRPKWQNW